MDRTRLVGWRLACVLVFGLVVLAAVPAAGSPQDVVVDWQTHGQIDGDYSITDLYNAKRLMLTIDRERAAAFAALVDQKIEKDFLGITPQVDPTITPVPTIPASKLPLWTTLTALAAAMLLGAGLASAIYLRRHRQRAG